MIKVAPSILACDFNNLEKEIKLINETNCEYIHCDIMDGHFVPNISFGPDILKKIKSVSNKELDVHLMIENVENFFHKFINSGANSITFHIEALKNPLNTIKEIKKLNTKVGLAIKPNTNLEKIINFIEYIDLVLIMTVEPGFGGQKFIYSQINKIKELKNEMIKRSINIDIQVDGGINRKTAKECINAGANILVAGSYIFNDSEQNYINKIDSLR